MKRLLAIALLLSGTAQAQDWYNAAWDYRVSVTVPNENVDSDLTDFPVYVDLSDLPAGFHTNVNQTDARDVRITKSDGTTEVAVDHVWYDSATDTGEIHHATDGTLSSTLDNTYYVYYGNAAATMPAADSTYGAEAVWGDYAVVWHMQDASSTTVADSTANGRTGTKESANPTETASGKTGPAQSFSGVGTSNQNRLYTAARTVTAPAALSVSCWAKIIDPVPGSFGGRLWSQRGNNGPIFLVHDDRYLQFSWIGGGTNLSHRSNNALWDLDVWHHFAISWDGSNTAANAKLYIDGTEVAYQTTTDGVSLANADGSGAWVGREAALSTSNTTIEAEIDEHRHLLSALSDNWLAAEYANQNDASTFYEVGSAEEQPSAGTPYYHRRMMMSWSE